MGDNRREKADKRNRVVARAHEGEKLRAHRAAGTPPEAGSRPALLRSWHRVVVLLALAAITLAWLAWSCTRDPRIRFLSRDARAEWILFPKAADVVAHGVGNLDTVFRRSFELADRPRAARLEWRAATRVELKINGAPLEIPPGRNWKDLSSGDAAALLRTGTNSIEARVIDDSAPPALWLTLTADGFTLRSDGTWEASCAGSAWRPAALASIPRLPGPGNRMGGGERSIAALRSIWPIWLVMTVIAAAIALTAPRWLGRWAPSNGDGSGRQMTLLLVAIGSLWVLLFANNAALAPFSQGFDSQQHLDYIKYVQVRHALPLPNEGFEMFQPPLYYVVCAAALSVCGATVDAPSGVLVLRVLTLVFGLLQIALVFLSLRLLFPGRRAPQLVGLALAAFLPMQLYLSHNVTNETLAALLMTASVYLGLRLLRTNDPPLSRFAWLGLCLGAAMLAKATAVLLIPPLLLAWIVRTVDERASAAIWLRRLGTLAAVFLAVCGWHYVRIWSAFGNPLLGNWDAASGFSWWQDPGFHTAADYARFGRSFVAPLFSGFWSVADGIYSTLWGDGLCGGAPVFALRPPWNYNLMVAGYVLALAPTLLILAGAAAALRRFVRKPSSDAIVLIGLSGAVALGLVFMTLKVASYAQVKAFYGLAMLVPLCFCAALGWEVLTRGRRVLEGALGALLLIWAMNSFASYWIVPSVPQHVYAGLRLGAQGNLEAARAEAVKAVESGPTSATAQRFLASASNDAGRTDEALSHAQRAVALDPMDGACHLQLGMILVRQNQVEPAIAEMLRALELEPENVSAYNLLQAGLSKTGRGDEAIRVALEGLAVDPHDAELHHALGVSLARKGELVPAARHFVYALLLRPELDQARMNFRLALRLIGSAPDGLKGLREVETFASDAPDALEEMAWFFATQPDASLRNGGEAVRLAERASALRARKTPKTLATLAAAYAENARIPEATRVAEEARLLAQSAGDAPAVSLTERLLAAFRAGRAYREEPTQK